MISYPLGTQRGARFTFPECISENAFRGWTQGNGNLQKALKQGEYNTLGEVPVFEGNFAQVTKRGEFVDIHNHPILVTMGIAASKPSMPLPDLMIIARDKRGRKDPKSKELEVTRLIPLDTVEMFVHDLSTRRLKINMVTGRTYYLQLTAPDGEESFLFERWMRLVYLLHVASGRVGVPVRISSKDDGLHTLWKCASLSTEGKKHWIPTIMGRKDSYELRKEQSHKTSSSRETQRAMQSNVAVKRSSLKSGYSRLMPHGILGSSDTQMCSLTQQPQPSVSKGPSRMVSSSTKQSAYGLLPQDDLSCSRSVSEAQQQYLPRQSSARTPSRPVFRAVSPRASSAGTVPRSRASVAVETSEFATMSVGIGPSLPFTMSEAVGPSRETMQTPRTSGGYGATAINLQKSSKSRSIVPVAASAFTSEMSTQSQVNAQQREEDLATESWTKSLGQTESARPLSQRGGSTIQSSSRKQSQPLSTVASTRAPSARTVPRSQASVAVESTQSQVNAQQREEDLATESWTKSLGQTESARPLSQRGGSTIQSSSGKQSQPLSTVASTRASSARTVPRSQASVAVESTQGQVNAQQREDDLATESWTKSLGQTESARPLSQRGGSTIQSSSRKQSQPLSTVASTRASSARTVPRSRASVAVGTSEFATMSVGIGPSLPFTMSEAVGPSRETMQTPRTSGGYGATAINLQKSSKSRSLVPVAASAFTSEMSTQSQVNAQQREEDLATESWTKSLGQTGSARPLSQGGGSTIQSSSRKQSQPLSTVASTRAPSARTVPRSRATVAVGPSDVYAASVAAGPSEAGALSVGVGPSKPASEVSRVASTKSRASERSVFTSPDSQSGSYVSRATSAKSKVSDYPSAKLLEVVNEVDEEAAGTRSTPISREMSIKSKLSEKVSMAPSEPRSRERGSTMSSGTVGMKSQEPSRLPSPRVRDSSSHSPARERSTSRSPSGRKTNPELKLHRATVSVACGPSQPGMKTVAVGPSETGNRPQSRVSSTGKKSETTKSSSEKSSSRDRTKSSNIASKQEEPSRSEVSKSGTKLKSALSSAKQRSSLTFVTIYSVLSSSMERLRNAKSKEEPKRPCQEETTSIVAAKPSKRVTISGVIGPSGKSALLWDEPSAVTSTETEALQMEMGDIPYPQSHASTAEGISDTDTIAVNVGSSVLGGVSFATESSRAGSQFTSGVMSLTSQQSRNKSSVGESSIRDMEKQYVSRATVSTSRAPERSRTSEPPSQLGSYTSRARAVSSNSRPSEKSTLTREGSRRTEMASLPPRSKISVGVGRSIVDTKSVAAGPSIPDNWSKAGDSWRPLSQPSAISGPPDRSRISMGMDRSIIETELVSMGRSADTGLSKASGLVSKRMSKEPSMRSQQQVSMGESQRPLSQPSGVSIPPDRSRMSMGKGSSRTVYDSISLGRSAEGTVSNVTGPSTRPASWVSTAINKEPSMQIQQQGSRGDGWRPRSQPSAAYGPADRSRISVGVGRSIIETESVGVGRSLVDTVSEAAGPSKPSSRGSTRISQEPSIRSQQQGSMGDGWMPPFRPSGVSIPPDRSRMSMGAGRSILENEPVRMGRSAQDPASKVTSSSKPSSHGSTSLSQEPSMRSQPQSSMGDGWMPPSRPSGVSIPPDRSRMSMGTGHSILENEPVSMGRSAQDAVSKVTGSSKPSSHGSTSLSQEPSMRSQPQSSMGDGWMPPSRPSGVSIPPDRSRMSMGAGRSILENEPVRMGRSAQDAASKVTSSSKPSSHGSTSLSQEPSMQSRPQSSMGDGWMPPSRPSGVSIPPDRSRMSMGAGRSILENEPVSMGRSAQDAVSKVTSSSKPSSCGSTRLSQEPSMQSQPQSSMDDGRRTFSQSCGVSGPPDKSLMSMGKGSSRTIYESISLGRSAEGTVSKLTSSSKPSSCGSTRLIQEPSIRSQQQGNMGDGWMPLSQPSGVSIPPDRSRMSTGKGSSRTVYESISLGRSAEGTVSNVTGPSTRPGSWVSPGINKEPSMQIQQQGSRGDGWRPRSQPSAAYGPADRSRISVGVGRSIIETESVGVGRSLVDTVSEAAGPSKPSSRGSTRLSQEPSIQSQQQGSMGDGCRPPSRPCGESIPPDRSRMSMGAGRSILENEPVSMGRSTQDAVSKVTGSSKPSSRGSKRLSQEPSMRSQPQSSMADDWRLFFQPSAELTAPDRSCISVGVGRSIIETKSAGVGRSLVDTISEAAGPSKPSSKIIARTQGDLGTRSQDNSVFKSEGWFEFVETGQKPESKILPSQGFRIPAAPSRACNQPSRSRAGSSSGNGATSTRSRNF